MYANLSWPKDLCQRLEKSEKAIMGTDLSGQLALLKDGFVGFKTEMQPNGFAVFYAKIAID